MLEGTTRIEAFSDGVIAIVVTLLILELHVPIIPVASNEAAFHALVPLIPKVGSFMVSFLTVTIFWVNHHHFFHPIAHSNGTLLWYNNALLFWLTVIPFASALLGNNPEIPLIVALYGFVLFMAALAFTLMTRYVFFVGELLPKSITMSSRRTQFRGSLFGVALYGLSVILAFLNTDISYAIFIIVPVFYFLPHRIQAIAE